jgi:polyhydroxybutyrate depolymerase
VKTSADARALRNHSVSGHIPRRIATCSISLIAALGWGCSADFGANPEEEDTATGGVGSAAGGALGTGGADSTGAGGAGTGEAAPMTGGAAGSGGGAATGGSTNGVEPKGPSAGCGLTVSEPAQQYVKHDMIVEVDPEFRPAYETREYHTRLPNNYDPNKAYPLYFWGNGCGVSQGNPEGIPVQDIEEARNESIAVFMIQEDGCFQAGKWGTSNSPDIAYFEQMLNEMEASYCIDRDHVFVGGWSSTAWLASTVSCTHGDRIRAIGMAAGGQQPDLPPCQGPTAAIFWAGQGDDANPIVAPASEAWLGSSAVRDRLIAENGCSQTTTPWDGRWPECQKYEGCDENPVVWCEHAGGHDSGGGSGITKDGFWDFFRALP